MTQSDFPSQHHRRLNILAGTWDTSITTISDAGSDSGTSQAIDIYTWMPNGHFLVHDVNAMMDDQHVQSTEIFGVDRDSGEFLSRSYDPDGSTNDFVSTIEGRDYTITGKVQRFTGHFGDDGRMLQGEWRQLQGDSWKPFIRIALTKRL